MDNNTPPPMSSTARELTNRFSAAAQLDQKRATFSPFKTQDQVSSLPWDSLRVLMHPQSSIQESVSQLVRFELQPYGYLHSITLELEIDGIHLGSGSKTVEKYCEGILAQLIDYCEIKTPSGVSLERLYGEGFAFMDIQSDKFTPEKRKLLREMHNYITDDLRVAQTSANASASSLTTKTFMCTLPFWFTHNSTTAMPVQFTSGHHTLEIALNDPSRCIDKSATQVRAQGHPAFPLMGAQSSVAASSLAATCKYKSAKIYLDYYHPLAAHGQMLANNIFSKPTIDYAANDECLFRKTFSATASAALTEYKIRLEGLRGFSSELMFYIVKTSLKDARTQFGSQNATTDSMGNYTVNAEPITMLDFESGGKSMFGEEISHDHLKRIVQKHQYGNTTEYSNNQLEIQANPHVYCWSWGLDGSKPWKNSGSVSLGNLANLTMKFQNVRTWSANDQYELTIISRNRTHVRMVPDPSTRLVRFNVMKEG